MEWSRFGGRGKFGEGVAFVVEVDVGEAELAEAVEEPGGTGVLGEGRGWDAEEFELPLAELWLVEMQPVEGAMDGGETARRAMRRWAVEVGIR